MIRTLLPVCLAASVAAQAHRPKLDRLFEHCANEGLFAGVARVEVDGEAVYERGFGLASEEWGIAHTAATRFRIASATKPFTATLVLRLVQAGELELEDSVSEVLPWFPPEVGSRIRVIDLLTQSSGLPRVVGRADASELMNRRYPTRDLILKFCAEAPTFEPGSRFAYTNANYMILAAIIEAVTGESYADAVVDLAQSFDLPSVAAPSASTIVERLATGYVKRDGAWRRADPFEWSNAVGSGSLVANARDLARLAHALHGNVLNSELRQRMFTPRHAGYACGWLVADLTLEQLPDFLERFSVPESRSESARLSVAMHPGDMAGFAAMLTYVATERASIVLLDNHDSRSLGRITVEVVKILLGLEPTLPRR